MLYEGVPRPEVAKVFFEAAAQAPNSSKGDSAMRLAAELRGMAKQSPPSRTLSRDTSRINDSSSDDSISDEVDLLI